MSQTIAAFSTGFEGKRPSPRTVHLATRMVRAARGQALEREFYVDDTDGALRPVDIQLPELTSQHAT